MRIRIETTRTVFLDLILFEAVETDHVIRDEEDDDEQLRKLRGDD